MASPSESRAWIFSSSGGVLQVELSGGGDDLNAVDESTMASQDLAGGCRWEERTVRQWGTHTPPAPHRVGGLTLWQRLG